MGFAESDLLYVDCPHRKLESEHHPYFIPKILFFHYSIIPLVTLRQRPHFWSEIKAWPSEPGFFTFPSKYNRPGSILWCHLRPFQDRPQAQ
jgi:hypothetical protein